MIWRENPAIDLGFVKGEPPAKALRRAQSATRGLLATCLDVETTEGQVSICRRFPEKAEIFGLSYRLEYRQEGRTWIVRSRG